MLTNQQISENYRQAMNLAAALVRKTYGLTSSDFSSRDEQMMELAQTVVGSEEIVALIQTKLFQPDYYRQVMQNTLTKLRKEFFPEVKKKQFLAIDAYDIEIPVQPESNESIESNSDSGRSGRNVEFALRKLSKENQRFLNLILRNTKTQQRKDIYESFGICTLCDEDVQSFNLRIDQIRNHFPDGEVIDSSSIDARLKMSESEIIASFKNVYFNIEKRFPQYFLITDGRKRASIMTRFLIEKILKTSPEQILKTGDELFFIKHKLQGVYRLFNYSMNRALHNAYPSKVPPWLFSRSFENYWKHQRTRTGAIQWLVENRLRIRPENIYQASITRNDFSKHGLSYLYNQYYNSVSKALLEAYPELHPWEAGAVPVSFWTDSSAADALCWMFKKTGWNEDELPQLFQQKVLNRKTFSQFGLATLFEKKFGKNIYKAVDCAFPGKFEPWQFGNVASEHWQVRGNRIKALRWIAGKEGIHLNQIQKALQSGQINLDTLKKYSIGTALKNLARGKIDHLFAPILWKNHEQFYTEMHLIGKLEKMIRREKQNRHLSFYLLYGFFAPNVQLVADDTVFKYERMLRRIKRRSQLETSI